MTPEQKQRAIKLIAGWRAVFWRDAGNDMAALLQEMIDTPEPEPVAHAVILPNGMTRIWFSDKERGEQWRKQEGIKQKLTPLYPAPPVNNHPEHHLEMVKQELFQAQQALLNEGQQRDKLLDALDIHPQSPVPMTEAELKIFKLGWLECRAAAKAAIAEVKGDK